MWVTLITIVSVLFFTYISGGRTQVKIVVPDTRISVPHVIHFMLIGRPMSWCWQAIDWTVAAFMVFLPLLGTLWWVYARREQALMDLAQGVQRPLVVEMQPGRPGPLHHLHAWKLMVDQMPGTVRPAVKVLLQHIALAHRTWLPLGVLPAAHLNDSRALLGMLVGALLHHTTCAV